MLTVGNEIPRRMIFKCIVLSETSYVFTENWVQEQFA